MQNPGFLKKSEFPLDQRQCRGLEVSITVYISDRNWLEFLSMLDATFDGLTTTSETTAEAQKGCKESVSEARRVFSEIAAKDGLRDRSGPLALLELEKRSIDHGLSIGEEGTYSVLATCLMRCITDAATLYGLIESYFLNFGDKACCYEDLKPYIELEGEELANWTALLEKQTSAGIFWEWRCI